MNVSIDQEKLKIPAFLRKKAIVRQAKQQLILTALDRKLAGLDVHSRKPLASIAGKSVLSGSIPVERKKTGSTIKNISRNKKNDPQKTTNNSQYGNFLVIPIGAVIDYYDKIKVAVVQLKDTLRIGDIIQIAAKDIFFQQPVESMQINRKSVKMAKSGADIGLKVLLQPQVNSAVYKVVRAETKEWLIKSNNLNVVTKTFAQPLF